MRLLFLTIFLVFECFGLVQDKKSDIIIFSYDRPLQLYLLLESMQSYMCSVDTITIIYRASNSSFDQAYQEIQHDFPYVIMWQQGTHPYQDFKPLTLRALERSPRPYVLFAVDDNVVKDTVDLGECIEALEKTGAYGFYLRLGKNLTYCLPYRCQQAVPPCISVYKDIYGWHFNRGTYDWAYPHTVDMALYRKQDVIQQLHRLSFTYPNTLECAWNGYAGSYMHRMGLCYEQSKIMNIPLNRVQPDFKSYSMEIDAETLLHIFNEGKKIDIRPLQSFNNTSAHYEYIPSYVMRK